MQFTAPRPHVPPVTPPRRPRPQCHYNAKHQGQAGWWWSWTTCSWHHRHVARCPNGKRVPPSGVCPKNPAKDVGVNPAVPDPVKGPGTTPVGTDPGPAVRPTDSPTGCDGPCPSHTTPSTAPPSGPGPVVLPVPTQSPTPATGNPSVAPSGQPSNF